MKRRILAWIYLILFVLLLVNMVFFRIFLTESIIVYGLMIALFFFTRGFVKGTENIEFQEGERELDEGGDGERYDEGAGDDAGSDREKTDNGRDGEKTDNGRDGNK